MKTTAIGFALALLAVPVQAQTPDDQRWAPWLGCWELVTENVRDAVRPTGNGSLPGRAQRVPDDTRPRVCVTPTSPNGATFTTTVAGKTVLEQTLTADATERPIDDAECRGTQQAEWSDDGLRLYARAQLTCGSDQTPRRVSGLALFGPDGTWLDVQAVEVSARENIRVRRYRRVAETAGAPVPRVTATRLTLDDVKDASAKVSPRAIEAALVETNASFDLTGSRLLDLDKAGVPRSVIDLVVALSYPDRFVVERTRDDRASTVFMNDPFMLGWAFGYPFWSAEYGFYSPLYGSYYSPYFYSPFAYSYLGRYDPRFLGGGGFAVVDGGGGGTVSPRPSGTGRVVDGQGYTRVRSREAETVSTTTAPISTAGSSSGSSSSSSSSSSGSSGGTSSGGSSGGDTGRTAVPR